MSAGDPDGLFCVAETTAGKVQGLINAGIRQFKAIPYGASTAGVNRFMRPEKPAPWAGVRECFAYGAVCPQIPTDQTNLYGQLIQFDLAVAGGGMGEDCLHLNVWTPALRDEGKRAVLVSFHGGGFAISSGNAAIYDGAELARLGDVVVVTVTHRLASFGFLDLSAAGFEYSGCTGIMDLVLALEWVRDNIANFGGDPGRVMIFGQSGGGWKTSVLLAAPSAKGLFHAAAIQSGSLLRLQTYEEAAKLLHAFLGVLGLSTQRADELRNMPWQVLLSAQAKVGAGNFAPVLDGRFLPHHPFDPAAPEESADIPLIISTVLDDAGLFFDNFDLDEAGLKKLLVQRYGEEMAKEIIPLYRSRWPRKSPFLLQAQITTDAGFRRFAHAQAELKAAQGRGAVYMYRWDWVSPGFDGLFGAAHATDVPASLHNVREPLVGAGSQPGRRLCDQLAAAWVAFAKTGNPNNYRMPDWPAYSQSDRATMIFDDPVRVERDPDGDIRQFWRRQNMSPTVLG